MTKQELRQQYNMSASTLRNLLNKRYYSQLVLVGYVKADNFISPKVLLKFYEIYGKPLTDDEK